VEGFLALGDLSDLHSSGTCDLNSSERRTLRPVVDRARIPVFRKGYLLVPV